MSTIICLEVTAKKSFAAALEWPGWCRAGKTPEAAVEALGEYASRYTPVARRAGTPLPRGAERFETVEELQGDGSTSFGVPGQWAAWELEPTNARQAKRIAALVVAAWDTLAEVAAGAPAELRKGPRGGGRDRDPIVAHVADAEVVYLRGLGVRGVGSEDVRPTIVELLSRPNDGPPVAPQKWPTRYAARRIAWHALDHAWEIEDKS